MLKGEAQEQVLLFQWMKFISGKHPEALLAYHVPNGGSRNKIEAINLKRQGVKSGVPDVCLPVARQGFHGLYIEMKYGKNKPTKEQTEWLEALKNQGYKTAVCWSFEEARQEMLSYLEG